MSKAKIIANLHLHAVLPRLQDLVRLDNEASSIASKMNLSVRFRVIKGPSIVIDIQNGNVTTRSERSARAQLGLLFKNCDQLNNMFSGNPAVPIPYGQLHKLVQMKHFTRLTEILTRYLKPSDQDLRDPVFKKKHLEMAFQAGLAGAAQIAKHDTKMAHVAQHLEHGSIQFNVMPDGPFAWVKIDQDRNFYSGPGKIDAPIADVEINGVDIAADLLADKLDTFELAGKGDLKLAGQLMQVEWFFSLLDRVGKFLD
ncbi:MAG: hypothetical protein QNJ97_11875 [Myxococcota bacterium]|nr:hypothetical protein [Myxococcota bacterium]